jgi:hypothetical protein
VAGKKPNPRGVKIRDLEVVLTAARIRKLDCYAKQS